MLTIKDTNLDLRLTTGKVKNLERLLDISLMSELRKSTGMLSFSLLEGLFSIGLIDVQEDKPIHGKKSNRPIRRSIKRTWIHGS
ncbi:hypothetical protein [Nosocomiicoccus massiliensis]|uniref:hypothetical protein n=1 Tax=Nosocomiicoccus massiliensis TaxID=1232430 RepID=UPI0004161670|nr:hypothetical protein [Nosocomiicoccus massiliensis]